MGQTYRTPGATWRSWRTQITVPPHAQRKMHGDTSVGPRRVDVPPNGTVDSLSIPRCVVVGGLKELYRRDDPTVILHQVAQELELRRREVNRLPVQGDLGFAPLKSELPAPQNLRPLLGTVAGSLSLQGFLRSFSKVRRLEGLEEADTTASELSLTEGQSPLGPDSLHRAHSDRRLKDTTEVTYQTLRFVGAGIGLVRLGSDSLRSLKEAELSHKGELIVVLVDLGGLSILDSHHQAYGDADRPASSRDRLTVRAVKRPLVGPG